MLMSFLRVILIIPFLALPLAASETGGGGGDENGRGEDQDVLSNRNTDRIVRILRRDFQRCQNQEKIYRWDCYRQTYRYAANQMNNWLSYSEAREAVEHVEQALEAVVTQYGDRSKPKRRRLTQTYAAIKPEHIPAAQARTQRAMEEAQTMLLRAPSHTQTQYVRIAAAINSNKVLLRSALLMLPNQLIRLAMVIVKTTRI